MNWIVSILEGAVFAAVLIPAVRRFRKAGPYLYGCFMLIGIVTVYLLYRGQDETVWPFFVHPYVSLLIVDLADLLVNKKSRYEKLFLWPFFVLPAMAGFVTCCGWILNIHVFRELFRTFF